MPHMRVRVESRYKQKRGSVSLQTAFCTLLFTWLAAYIIQPLAHTELAGPKRALSFAIAGKN